jgi:hypothetical protein
MKLMRKVIPLVTFSIILPFVFLFTLVYLLQISSRSHSQLYFANNKQINAFSYAALPPTLNTFSDNITVGEGRVEMIRQFLAKYNSPLEPYAGYIVEMADKYSLDFRLIPAIAMQESNLCKKIPAGSNNCWGFGIYGNKITSFSSYPEAIETVTKTLALKYRDKGLVTPEEIMSMYTPSSNGSWAHGVNHFMQQLQ